MNFLKIVTTYLLHKSFIPVFLLFLVVSNAFAQGEEFNATALKAEKRGDLLEAGRFYNKAGLFYWEIGKFDEAITNFRNSIRVNEKTGNKNALKTLHTEIGFIYSESGKHDQALKSFQTGYDFTEKENDRTGMASNLINISKALTALGKYNESISKLDKALELSSESYNKKLMSSCYVHLAENYEQLGNSEMSLKYFDLYSTFEKEIQKIELAQIQEESKKKIERLNDLTKKAMEARMNTLKALKEREAELEKKDSVVQKGVQEIENLNVEKAEKDSVIVQQDETIKKSNDLIKAQNKVQFLSYAALALMGLILVGAGVIGVVLYRGNQKKKKTNAMLASQKNEIEEKNQKIEASINYALRIQNSILPNKELLHKYASDSMVYFKPRDVVSGDFYWMHELDDKLLIAAVDCTGHGVPGAFMSLIGFNLLNGIVEAGFTDPDKILTELNIQVRRLLKQDDNDSKDGMDMALCMIDKSNQKLTFSGAKNPLVYFQNGEMEIVKGDIHPIGGKQKEELRVYSKHEIDISIPTSLYLFSDGYQDQFGGPKGRKFMVKKFKALLGDIHSNEMKEQESTLENQLTNWMGQEYKQVDDILIIGFKID